MNPCKTPRSALVPVDPDLSKQAKPGYGIPSQDPDPAAQVPQKPGEARREANSVLAGGGVIVGTFTGVVIGTVVAGPVGAVVGATVGAVAGALGGAAAGPMVQLETLSATDAEVASEQVGRTGSGH